MIRDVNRHLLSFKAITAVLLAAGCQSQPAPPVQIEESKSAEVAVPPAAPESPLERQEPAPHPSSAAGVADLIAAAEEGSGGDASAKGVPALARFREAGLTTADITQDTALAEAIETLARSDRGQAVFDELGAKRDASLPVLRKALWHKEPNVRIHVAKMLHLFKDRTDETTDALVDVLLHDADNDVRAVVARVLVSHKPKRAVPALIMVVETDPFVHARANAVRALGEIRDSSGAGAVKRALTDKESWVRLRALGAAQDLKLRDARPIIERLANDSNPEVKKKAQKVLAVMRR